jgi:hypothetical protein
MTEERARHYAKALVRSGACRKRPPRRPYPLAEGNERHGPRQSLTWPGDRGFESAFLRWRVRPQGGDPWRGATAFPDYSELMRGKASCHVISPISGDPLTFVAAGGRDGL